MRIEASNLYTISIYTSIAIIVVLVLRRFLKKLPADQKLLIWTPILLQLVIPYTIKVEYSLSEPSTNNILKIYQVIETQNIPELRPIIMPDSSISLNIQDVLLNLYFVITLGILLITIYRYVYFQIQLNKHSTKRNLLNKEVLIVEDLITTSAVFGIIRPQILVSSKLLTRDDQQLEMILEHEKMHITKKHHLINFLLIILKVVYWYDPFVYIMAKEIRNDMECSVDEALISYRKVECISYANLLVDMVQVKSKSNLVYIGNESKYLKERIKNMFVNKKSNMKKLLLCCVCVAICAYCLIIPEIEQKQDYVIEEELYYRNLDTNVKFQLNNTRSIEITIKGISEEQYEGINQEDIEVFIDFQNYSDTQNALLPIQIDWGNNMIPVDHSLNYTEVEVVFYNENKTEEFILPVDNMKITCQWNCYAGHQAIDMIDPAVKHANVYAVKSGNVIESDYDEQYGNYVVIQHNEHEVTRYHHLNERSSFTKGSYVLQGDMIGQTGESWEAYGSHVHFELLIDGLVVDPADYLPLA